MQWTRIGILCLLFGALDSVQSATISGFISPNKILSAVSDLDPTTSVVLDGGRYETLVRADGRFFLQNVPQGSYSLEIQSNDYVFPRLRVDVEQDSVSGQYSTLGAEWSSQGYPVSHPFNITARAKAEYFLKRQGFNWKSILYNPMFLMAGFSMLMMFVMPKMMENMDPESLKEIQQGAGTNPANIMSEMPSLSQMLADHTSGGSQSGKKK